MFLASWFRKRKIGNARKNSPRIENKKRLVLEELESRLCPSLTVPAFSSLPGANHTIYLDFDGHTTTKTLWNSEYNKATIVSGPYNSDSDASDFSSSELADIEETWNRVAEDFIPVQVNVTTEEPDIEALRKVGTTDTQWGVRVVITPDNFDAEDTGGLAYIASFDWNSDTPAFIFVTGGKDTAEATSHEIGHTLGLDHDGVTGDEYYEGHGSGATSWGPIMGSSYTREVTTWSKGEYFGYKNPTNNNNKGPDDLAVITTKNGFGYRSDDHGNDLATAAPLNAAAGSSISGAGIIETNTDVDVFSFSTGSGTVTLDIHPFAPGPNLDVKADLFDSLGNLVATSDPTTSLSGNFSLTLAAGFYYLQIDGTGVGNPTSNPPSGYTDYGSLGRYTISGNLPNTAPLLGGIDPNSQQLNDNSTISPFSTVTLTDPDLGQTQTVTITYTAANGIFSNLGGFTGSAGSYTFQGSASAAQSAIQGLVFQPTNNQVAVGSTVTTFFTINVNDGLNSTSDNQTNVVTTSAQDNLVFGGIDLDSQPVNDNATINPFSTVTITDLNPANTQTVTINYPAANGIFSNLGGFTGSAGSYTFTGSLSQAQASLQGLVFHPTPNQVAVGSTVTTTFALTDSNGTETISNNQTAVVATSVNDPPTLGGINTANQALNDDETFSPFSTVTLTDPDPAQVHTVIVTYLSANGTFTNLSGFTGSAGSYTFTGNLGDAQAALQSLVFIPTISQVPVGSTVVTAFTITLHDGVESGSNNKTTVVVTSVPHGAFSITTGKNVTTTFRTADQTLLLSANVTSFTLINEGTVTFTVRDSLGNIIGSPATSGTVLGGKASALFLLPGGTAWGTYTIAASYNGTSNFRASSDGSKVLTTNKAATVITGSNATALLGTDDVATLNATVTSTFGLVNEGTVTFTVRDSAGNIIGSQVTSAAVSNGQATAEFTLPDGMGAGVYKVAMVYNGEGSFKVSKTITKTLTVSTPTSILANDSSVTFRTTGQRVALTATVSSAFSVVQKGIVTFTILDGFGNIIGKVANSGPVLNGQAKANFFLPAGTSVGVYTIFASYKGTAITFPSSNSAGKLTVTSAPTTTTAKNVVATFRTSDQTLLLSTSVKSIFGLVNEGTATFTVRDGLGNVIGSPVISGTVVGSRASASFLLPDGTTAGTYFITVGYSGGNNFQPSSDSTKTLTLNKATTIITGPNATAFLDGDPVVTFQATVTNTFSLVNEGTVTFTVRDSFGTIVGSPVTSNTVSDGQASADFTLPDGMAAGTYKVTMAYFGEDNFKNSLFITRTLTVS